MLEGLVAAGFYICFFEMKKGAVFTGVEAGVISLIVFLLPEIRFAVPVLTTLWIMAAGFWFCREGREELFLAGGVWLMAWSLAGCVSGAACGFAESVNRASWSLTGDGSEEPWGLAGALAVGEVQTAIAAALLLVTALYLLGRGKPHPMWIMTLALLWMLTGYLGSIPYTKSWQRQGMAVSLYLTAAGMLTCQQISCARQALNRSFRDEDGTVWRDGPGRASEMRRQLEEPGWREAADREFRQLQIFEHDFRHHLDMVGALYEAGSREEARAYLEDLKQARVSRQGRRIGGERELSYIMLAKKEACRQAGIAFSYQILGSPRGIAQMDMTALLLNLLDNAVRACMEAPSPRSISVMLLARGDLWEIEMTNSGCCEPGREAAGIHRGADGAVHGVGLVSVRQIVEKYQGSSRIWQEDGKVRQKLILVQRPQE